MNLSKTLAIISLLFMAISEQGCAPKANSTSDKDCLKIPESSSPAEKTAALALYTEILASLDKPDADVAYNFKLIAAFARPNEHALDQLVLIQSLICIRDHHSEKVSPQIFDQMKLNLIFAIVKSMGEHNLSVAKQKWLSTSLGPEKVAAMKQLGI